ncbi:spectrin beta chain, non-erythrocytic 1-like isoform X1 [Dermacentor albipictus]|uniref:spectrin beta chain, non-erythrocytic 1-like isoform X1 n=1 Tax=Dermacentor albipictus TaxID=60249 RepID=UPI0038FC45AE
MSQRADAMEFEKGRIRALQEERLHIQKKTFTKWMNSFLQKARMEVDDLFVDLADGKKLLKLLEIISGEKLGKPNNGKMRVHKIENVNKSLAFLHTKVRLESIGAEDIVDGNPRLILGLIWTIILRFQIQDIEIDVDEDNESSEKKSAKDALLLWCQRKTSGYPAVNIQDFSSSWRSGMGFNALIHSHRPDLIDYGALEPVNHIDNLNNAFNVAQRELGIPRLLDAEDIDTNKPDEKSVMTYVASYYHTFARMKNEMKQGRRIANIVAQMMDADRQKYMYERLTSKLLEWIQAKTAELQDHCFPNSLEGIQGELLKFKEYRTVEKPPKYKERSDIEALLFDIQTKQKALGRPLYVPPEGKMAHDIQRAWEQLEEAEHAREVALREELLRQKKLENLACRFDRKSAVREGYLREMVQVLSDPRYGSNLSQVEATVKKHEAISADILAREERFQNLTKMADQLEAENYHAKARIRVKEKEIMGRWQLLLDLLNKHRVTLNNVSMLMSMLREADTLHSEIKEVEGSFLSDEYGCHLLAVEDLLQKHALDELNLASQGEAIRRLTQQSTPLLKQGHKEGPVLQRKLDDLNADYATLGKLAKRRRRQLDEWRAYFQFVQDHEEEEAWIREKQRICKAVVAGKDLLALVSLQQKHKALEAEIGGHDGHIQRLILAGEKLLEGRHSQSADVKQRLQALHERWAELADLAAVKRKRLEDAYEAFQYHADANEAESWVREKLALVSSKDYGKDEPSAQALLQRHSCLESEMNAYGTDIRRLRDQADRMVRSGVDSLAIYLDALNEDAEPSDDWTEELQLVPVEEWVDEVVEKEAMQTVVEERKVPQVKALYPFSGQNMNIQKGEIMTLLNRTNADWWNVRQIDGEEGFVPANYVRELEPRIIQKTTMKPVKVAERRRVKKVVMKQQPVKVKKEKRLSPQKSPKQNGTSPKDGKGVQQRQESIEAAYQNLLAVSKERRHYLEDAIRLFGFFRECSDFEAWMVDKEKMLTVEDPKENVEVRKKKFENFLTDMSASKQRMDEIDRQVGEFVQNKHSQLDAIRSRSRQIHSRWDRLNQLKTQKERSLEGATSVELFHRTCDDARDWMTEKMQKIDIDEVGRDMKTVQALQRRHENLERELAPVEEKFNRVNLLADSVKAAYPTERSNVVKRQSELQGLWDQVKDRAAERRSRLEDSMGLQILANSAKSLLAWVSEVKVALNSFEPARDVATAEDNLKKHHDLGDDIRNHEDEFADIQALGEKLLLKNKDNEEMKATLKQLQEEQNAIHRGWQEKLDYLRQAVDLQMFNREADQIDSITSSHDALLDFEDLGTTLDDVEALSKRHENLINTLLVQDQRVAAFSGMADKLIAAGHCKSKEIDKRRNQVVANRQAVKDKAYKRKELLEESRVYHEFKAESAEMSSWIQDKLKMAADDSYRDLTNLERKLQKHEAFEAELKANEARLHDINANGQSLIAGKHYASDDVRSVLDYLDEQWQELCRRSNERGQCLRQASAQRAHNRALEDARVKLDELEAALASRDLGHDLRSVKELLKRHQALEAELTTWEAKVLDLVQFGKAMADKGHFDASNILKATRIISDRFGQLREPAEERRKQLEESLKLHQFNFDVDTEKQWITEHLSAASSLDLGQNLIDAQNLFKKHQKLEREVQGHQAMVDKTLAAGDALVKQRHFAAASVKDKCHELVACWNLLLSECSKRRKKLELQLKAQTFYSEVNEIEAWMNEKKSVLTSTDFGRDEDAAVKLLTKQKALELEIDTYSGLVVEMTHQGQAMIDQNHPDSKIIANQMQTVNQEIKNLQKLSTVRRQKLMEAKHTHEFFRESDDLQDWINEQTQAALSEDYGKDYEHLLLLQAKFEDLKLVVDTGKDRLDQCIDLGQRLIAADVARSGEIEKCLEHLDYLMQALSEAMQAREQKLQAAGEIHRFNRDVADALSRIQEKYTAIPEELGKDLQATQSLVRRQEGFENDLVALEAQLQVLVDDSVRLQAAYPGGNAEHIAEQQQLVVDQWAALQEKVAQRKDQLKESLQLQKFLSMVRDLETWARGLCSELAAKETVRSATGAQTLKSEHDQVMAEIEAREESFSDVLKFGKMMMDEQHYATAEIQERLSQLLQARDDLHLAWQHKKVYLDQLLDLHFFLRDAKQLDTLSAQQEVYLSGTEVGTTVEEVDANVKKHEAFEKLMATQDEKLQTLEQCGAKLVQQNHFESGTIRKRMEEVAARRAHVKQLSAAKRQKLAEGLLLAQFRRDAAEAEAWVASRRKQLEAQETSLSADTPVSLEEKVKQLQKHQAFQAELAAHEGNIAAIKQKGELLLSKKHPASGEVREQLSRLLQLWEELLDALHRRGRGLEEAQDMLDFESQVDKVEAWIRDKELMVQAGDTGEDYEHCQALQRKLDDVDSDMRVDDGRIKNINALADKLIKEGRPNTHAVQQRREKLNRKWKALQGALEAYRAKLAAALEVHAFKRDIDDTVDRINEKAIVMTTKEESKSLRAVESLQRRQDAVEREMTTIDAKLRDHEQDCERLMKKHGELASPIRAKVVEVQENWKRLMGLCNNRKQTLAGAYQLHKFLTELKGLEAWVNDLIERMNSGGLGTNMQEAESLLEFHQECKAEMEGRQDAFERLHSFGNMLLRDKHPASDVVEKELERLEELRQSLRRAWEERAAILRQCKDLQVFREQAKQAEAWLSSKEAVLNNEDLGDSMSSVDVLTKKHAHFEQTMETQGERINHMEEFARALVQDGHYDSAAIQAQCDAVCARRQRLQENAQLKRRRLAESRQFQRFLRNVYEVEAWLNEKLQVACDENYRDPVNLPSKTKKHAAFEAEILAHRGRVETLLDEGQRLVEADHYASDQIESRLEAVERLWAQLLEQTKLKKDRLQDSYHALLFNWMLDDLQTWMDDVETQLQSEDHGKDLTSVQNLLKKQQLLETDITNHAEMLEQVKDQAANFQKNDHFLKNEIQERADSIVKRYTSLHEPLQIRRENLEEALQLQQLLRDVDDEMSWIREKEPLASSADLGTSLSSVQSLQKKHQGLEADIQAHEPLVASVGSKGRQMIRSGHFAASEVEKRLTELQLAWGRLKDAASVRRLRLLDALESHTFYSEATEAEAWMEEKFLVVNSPDLGKDEDSVLALTKKLDGVDRDVDGFNANITRLMKQSTELVDRGHFDSANISAKMKDLEELYTRLKKQIAERRWKLSESAKFYTFLRETDEVLHWIQTQTAIAGSEDYGTDLERVEILMQKFDVFLTTLQGSEDRVRLVQQLGRTLIAERHPQSDTVAKRCAEVAKLWEECKECAASRQDALAGARQVHTFDRNADETISWIYEKEAVLLNEDFGHDLESIQALSRRHEGFQRDLAAVREQVETLLREARRLAETFPDAREHIEAKQDEVSDAWSTLMNRSHQRGDKLHQAEQLQAYFDEYRELMAWLNDITARITSDELARDVTGAEALLARHREHRAEMDARAESFSRFVANGDKIIASGHFMSDEVRDRIRRLSESRKVLEHTWKRRQEIYDQSLDLQLFLRDADQLETWLASREAFLRDDDRADSISAVEELIRKHDDFMKTVEAQEDRFDTVKRITKLEEAFKRLKQEEEEMLRVEEQKREQDRVDAMKRKEHQRILDERMREDGLRRPALDSSQLSAESNGEIAPSYVGGLVKSPSQRSLDSDRKAMSTLSTPVTSPVKRAESMKVELGKKLKRTPSFTTRRRAQSFRRSRTAAGLPAVEMEGFLDRKHELQSGGKKATIRSWKTFYTVLCGQLLCFFKDKEGFVESNAAAPPVSLLQAHCTKASNYTKKKHAFRLRLADGVEFLFVANSETSMSDWVNKISFHAALPPSLQLLSYDEARKSTGLGTSLNASAPNVSHRPPSSADSDTSGTPLADRRRRDQSSTPSPCSSPEMRHTVVSSHPQGSVGAAPPQVATRVEREKPPIPPRNSSIRSSASFDVPDGAGSSVKSKIQMFQQSAHSATAPAPPPSYSGMLPSRGSSHAGNLLAEEVANKSSVDGHSPPNVHNGYGSRPSSMIGTPPTINRTSADGYSSSGLEDSPPTYVAPPLPSQPPPKPRRPEDSDSDIAGTLSDGDQEWRRGYSKNRGEDKVQYRETYHPRGDTPSGATVARHASLPGSGNPPANLASNLQQYSATLDHRHQRAPSSEGSSEGDYGDKKSRDRKKGVLSLFRKR